MSAMEHLKNLSPLGQMVVRKGQSFIHNPVLLNLQSLIMASLVLVINRSVIANYSALKAKDTPDGPYRTHEAYRTTIREFLGFTGGFVVLRQIQSWIKNRFRDALRIEDPPNPNKYSLKEAFKAWRKNPTEPALPFEPKVTSDLTPKVNIGTNKEAQKFIRWTEKIPGVKFANNATKEAYIRHMYNLGPIVLASIPTVALAGVLLEKFTRDHADHLADMIGAHFGGKKQAKTSPSTPEPFSVVSVAVPPVLPAASPNVGLNPPQSYRPSQPSFASVTPFSGQQRITQNPIRQTWTNSPL